jgi:hypothetical protein
MVPRTSKSLEYNARDSFPHSPVVEAWRVDSCSAAAPPAPRPVWLQAADRWTDISSSLLERLTNNGAAAWPGGCSGVVVNRTTAP